jgi:hypothetical protein
MRKIFSAVILQLASARRATRKTESERLVRAENPDFLDFWRKADVFAYQARQSMKYHALLRANRFIDNYEIVREAARYYDDGWYDGTQDLGSCFCVLPPFTLQFDEKASPKTNIDTLSHKLDCWIQESLNKIKQISFKFLIKNCLK